VTRILSAFRKRGLIEVKGASLFILDRKQMEEMAK
jgi:hypothetical protein